MKKLLLVLSLLLALISSNFAQNTEGGKKETVTQTTPQADLPQLPMAIFQRLWDSCTLVDYTFFTMPITISLDRKAAIQSSLRGIGGGVAVRKSDCKVFAKLFFQINAKLVMDADLYFSDNGCSYAVYNIGGKATYMNPISTEGVQFLNQIVERQKGKKQ